MSVSKLICPKCKTVLRPTKPLPAGKKVKCPKCATDFTAAEGDAETPSTKQDNPEPASASKKKAAKPAAKKVEPKAAPKKPDEDEDDGAGTYSIVEADRPKSKDDPDDEDEDDPNKVDFVPDQSIKDLRGPAQAAVIRPSNMLLLNGVVGFFGWAILFIILIIPVIFPAIDDEADKEKDAPTKPVLTIPNGLAAANSAQDLPVPKGAKEEKKQSLYVLYIWDLSMLSLYPWFLFALYLSPIFFGMAYACVMTYGAVQMQNLESRVWGIVANIMCLIPIATGGFVVVCSMVITLVVYMITEDLTAVGLVLIAFVVMETLGCIGIGVTGLLTLMRQEVIDGYEYVPDV